MPERVIERTPEPLVEASDMGTEMRIDVLPKRTPIAETPLDVVGMST